MNKILISIFVILSFLTSSAQTLYTPINIQKAYEKGTRSYDGKPGVQYWVNNNTEYNIRVRFDPASRIVSGEENIHYRNSSPDTLRTFVFRLYQDLYKIGNCRDFIIDKTAVTDGVRIETLAVNNNEINLTDEESPVHRKGTNLFLTLPDSLLPDSDISFRLKWRFTLPNRSQIRMGAYQDSSFFISLWYPQIAVYDDIDGWDKYFYTGNQEFYNDFKNFNVEITVPDSFLVWATGILENPRQILDDKYLARYNKAHQSDSVIHIIRSEDYRRDSIFREKGEHTFLFKADFVPDFAFAVGYNFLWDGINLSLKKDKKDIFISAAFREESEDFKEVAEIAYETIKYLSKELPGIPYPYPEMTVFNGRGGMEYPMIINDGSSSTRKGTVHLTSHEITHTYFPFYMGINEGKYAWMDEGWAQMLPFVLQERLAEKYDPIGYVSRSYAKAAGREMDVPLMVPSIIIGGNSYHPTYRNAAYNRPAMAYLFLKDLLGEKLFKKALQTYMERWNGKHPLPYDFFYTFDNIVGEDLSWYWKPWFFETGYPDLAVKDVVPSNKGISIIVSKEGNIPVPVKLQIIFSDSTQDSLYQTAKIWKNGQKEYLFYLDIGHKSVKKVELDCSHIPDVNKENNTWISN